MLKEPKFHSLFCDLTMSPFFRLTVRQSTTTPQRLSIIAHPIKTSAESLQGKLVGLAAVGRFTLNHAVPSGGPVPHLRLALVCEGEGFSIDRTLEALGQLAQALVGDD